MNPPQIAPSGRRWKGQAQCVDDVDEGGDACVGLRRETYPGPDPDGTHEGNACAAGQRDVRHPGVQAGGGPATLGAAARILWGLGARRLSGSDSADPACWATWDLHAQVIPQLATELGAVTNVADGDLAEQATQRLEKAGI